MKRVIACAALLLAACTQGGQLRPLTTETPKIAEDFQLVDQNRAAFQLRYFEDAPAIVLMSYAGGDKVSEGSAKAIAALKAEYGAKGVVFALINAKQGATYDTMAAEAKSGGFDDVRVLLDETQLVSEALTVARTGEAFVIDPRAWMIVYHGPVDDRFTTATLGGSARQTPVKDTLDTLLSGKMATPVSYETGGAAITYPPHATATYTKDIAPILEAKCVSCHTDGGIAPFAMDGYESAKKHAPMMRSALRTQRMPPFYADRHTGKWKHDLSLTADEIRTIVHWAEDAAPRGEGDDPMTAKRPAPSEWPLGKPDIIFPALNSGGKTEKAIVAVDLLPITRPQTAWLRAVTINDGGNTSVHDISLRDGDAGKRQRQIAIFSRGAPPMELPPDTAMQIANGLAARVYFIPDNATHTEQTRVAVYLNAQPPKFEACSVAISKQDLNLSSNKADQMIEAERTLKKDVAIYSITPIMHDRGSRTSLTALYPDGHEERLLDLPRFDFNWLRDYALAEPKALPAGTKLVAHFVYDNSERNQTNPDATKAVTAGPPPNGEAAEMWVGYHWADGSRGCEAVN